MPAAWQASGTLLGSTGADITPVIPAHAADDLMLLLASSRDTTETLTTPDGWGQIGALSDTTNWRTYAFWKRTTSGAETNPLCDWSAATGQKYGQVHTLRGADWKYNRPYQDGLLSSDTTNPIGATGIIPTRDNLLIVAGIGSDNASTAMTSVTSLSPASFTERHFSTIATGNDATGWFYTGVATPNATTGTIVSDFNSTMPAAATLVLSIRDIEVSSIVTAVART
jgi:hypothetical protein